MSNKKSYELPESTTLLMDKSFAAGSMKKLCLHIPFGYWKARKCAVDELRFRRLFWMQVQSIYPDLDLQTITYTPADGKLQEKD